MSYRHLQGVEWHEQHRESVGPPRISPRQHESVCGAASVGDVPLLARQPQPTWHLFGPCPHAAEIGATGRFGAGEAPDDVTGDRLAADLDVIRPARSL